MARKPNYGQQRADVNRAKQAKKDEREAKRQAKELEDQARAYRKASGS